MKARKESKGNNKKNNEKRASGRIRTQGLRCLSDALPLGHRDLNREWIRNILEYNVDLLAMGSPLDTAECRWIPSTLSLLVVAVVSTLLRTGPLLFCWVSVYNNVGLGFCLSDICSRTRTWSITYLDLQTGDPD